MNASAAVNIFFLGKGGVGKSTSSALTALLLARDGRRVLLVSLDPAHNQCDIFEKSFGDRPLPVTEHLQAIEVDQESWIKRYLKEVHRQIKRTYAYLTAMNLEGYFKVIKHSPGLEEYALILAFNHIRERFGEHDVIVWDMPPTALSLKFFSLPSLSLIWLEHLLNLRREIIRKRELITTISLGKREVQRDKVLNAVTGMRDTYQELRTIFEDSARTRVNLVLNPDRLSFAESVRIFRGLGEIGIGVHQMVYNKMDTALVCAEIDPAFAGIPQLNFPLSQQPLIGLDTLCAYLDANAEAVHQQRAACLPAQ